MTTEQKLLLSIIERQPQSKAEFDVARTQVCAGLKIMQPANRELLTAYQNLLKKKRITRDHAIEKFLRKADVRSQSGIAIVTSLVKPYTCPGKCVYCPTEVRMPKSYIASEPAAARALRLDFSPYEQMRQRVLMLEANGHPTDKIEYIIKGGTWNAYPLRYQYWFVLESFVAANAASKKTPTSQFVARPPLSFGSEAPENSAGRQKTRKHRKHLGEDALLEELQNALEFEQERNEKAKHRIIGITLETRPDAISPKTIFHMRQMGCTRIELGLQAPDDKILALIKRGHTVQEFRDAMCLLRQAGFKVDLHFMPDLPGTTPEHDVDMYKLLFSDPGLKPDMVKIYPNTVIPSAELYQWFLDGRYKPYGEKGLFDALLQMKLATPRYCRISRLIRDIPATEIAAGNVITNLREALEKELHKRGQQCVCLRCREIGRHRTENTESTKTQKTPELFIEKYNTVGGTEYFLSFEDTERIAVYGFLRLRIPRPSLRPPFVREGQNKTTPPLSPPLEGGAPSPQAGWVVDPLYELIPEIRDCAFIRELHVYGQMVGIGKREDAASQHKGLGKQLVQTAEGIARKNGYTKVAVISGVGVRDYYRKLGYRKSGTYMIKSL